MTIEIVNDLPVTRLELKSEKRIRDFSYFLPFLFEANLYVNNFKGIILMLSII